MMSDVLYALLNTGGTPILALLEVHPFGIFLTAIFLMVWLLYQLMKTTRQIC